jgi:hypothetical protein
MSLHYHHNFYLINEQNAFYGIANNFDVYNAESSDLMLNCREENLGFFTKLLRYTKCKMMTPLYLDISSVITEPLLCLRRGFSLFGYNPVIVYESNGIELGKLVCKFINGGASIEILDTQNYKSCTLKGNLLDFDFKIIKDQEVLAVITRNFAGLEKDLFTSPNNYILEISNNLEIESNLRPLILSAVLCINFLLN